MGSYPSHIAGLEYRPRAARRVAADLNEDQRLTTKREPANRYDANAVALYAQGQHLGYLPRSHAAWAAERIDEGGSLFVYVRGVHFRRGWIFTTVDKVDLLIVTSIRDAPYGTEEWALYERQMQSDTDRLLLEFKLKPLIQIITECIAVLKWIGNVGDTATDRQTILIEDLVVELARSAGIEVNREIIDKLTRQANRLKGSKARATKALPAIGADRSIVAALSSVIIRMISDDGTITAKESAAATEFIAEMRRVCDTK